MLTRTRDILRKNENDKQDGKQRIDVVSELERRGGQVMDWHVDHEAADERAQREVTEQPRTLQPHKGGQFFRLTHTRLQLQIRRG